jgi:hypothetical protein
MSELSAKLDSIVGLNIYKNCKGRALFLKDNISLFRFSDIILLLGSLIILFWGYETLNKKEYLRFLANPCNHKKIFAFTLIIRGILLTLSLVILFLFQFALANIHKINLSQKDFSGLIFYFLTTWIVLLIFFLLGVIDGNIRSNVAGISVIIGVWFFLVLFLPGILNHATSERAGNIVSNYKIEVEKMQVVNDFENRCEEKAGKFSRDNIDMERQFVEEYWSNDYRQIEALEDRLKSEIAENIDRYRNTAILTPATFYRLTGSEVSSRGYENFLDFYSYLQEMKRKFVRFYLDRVYYNNPKELVSFIKGDENIFYARSRLGENYWHGMLIMGLYCFVLFVASLLVLHCKLHRKIIEGDKIEVDLNKLEKGKAYFLLYRHEDLKNRFFGQSAKQSNVLAIDRIKGEDIDPGLPPDNIVPYLCHIRGVKDIEKVNSFIQRLGLEEYKYFSKFKKRESLSESDLKKIYAAIVLAEAEDKHVILINDFLSGVNGSFEQKFIGILLEYMERGKTIIYLGTEMYMSISEMKLEEMRIDGDFEIIKVNLKIISLR